MSTRAELLASLVRLDRPLAEIAGGLAAFAWDSEELVTLGREHVLSVLERYLAGLVSAEDLEEWANLLECRDDVALDPACEEDLRQLVFDLANPLLAGPITREAVFAWLARLRR